ncbi:MAG: hypothetical protein ACXABO_11170 [Promethearchaeota archaeon]
MILYSVYENGSLRKVSKIDFTNLKVYLIDDFKIIYLWFGSKSSKKKKDFALKRAEKLNLNRKSPAKIQIQNQNKEFGVFITLMDLLKKGLKDDMIREKRDELRIDIEDTMELIDAGLEVDLEGEITIAAHQLSQEEITYEDLSKRLAELQLILLKGKSKPLAKDIDIKAKEILNSSSTYEELCWLVSELEILVKKKDLE